MTLRLPPIARAVPGELHDAIATRRAEIYAIPGGAEPIMNGRPPNWPQGPEEPAFHGLPGEIVRLIEPHTEADPAAVLVQFLAAAGNAFGREPCFRVEADVHHCNLFAAVVGDTAKGRKGTSFGQARRPVELAEEDWATRVAGGLSSGEGLIWQVRDPIVKQVPVREKGKKSGPIVGYDEETVDGGVADKRLFIYESEFASVLGRMGREGNALSAVIRQAWDGGTLNTLTKNSPAKATGAHISVVAHITEDELRRELTATDMANGFANRFLWICARRSKKLPHGGAIHEVDWAPITRALHTALNFARQPLPAFDLDAEARGAWEGAYDRLSEGLPGMLGAVTSRAEAQVRRLAVIYAVLDREAIVLMEHLNAALAIWDYCERSCRYLFGNALGDPLADQILAGLKRAQDGLTRTEMSRMFAGHKKSDDLNRALGVLERGHLARMTKRPVGAGRPEERWHAT